MKQDVEKLRTLSLEYDSSVLELDSSLSSELLEKTLYLRRRDWESMDID